MHTIKERGEEGGRRNSSSMLSGDVEARGVKEGNVYFLLYPLAGRIEQVLLPLFLFSFISFFLFPTLLSLFDTRGPAEASAGSRDNDVKDHQAHKHDNKSQLEVLHTHGSCKVTTCGLKSDR